MVSLFRARAFPEHQTVRSAGRRGRPTPDRRHSEPEVWLDRASGEDTGQRFGHKSWLIGRGVRDLAGYRPRISGPRRHVQYIGGPGLISPRPALV